MGNFYNGKILPDGLAAERGKLLIGPPGLELVVSPTYKHLNKVHVNIW